MPCASRALSGLESWAVSETRWYVGQHLLPRVFRPGADPDPPPLHLCVVCISVVFLHANPSVLCTQDAQAPEPLHGVAMHALHGLRETAAEADVTHVICRE